MFVVPSHMDSTCGWKSLKEQLGATAVKKGEREEPKTWAKGCQENLQGCLSTSGKGQWCWELGDNPSSRNKPHPLAGDGWAQQEGR